MLDMKRDMTLPPLPCFDSGMFGFPQHQDVHVNHYHHNSMLNRPDPMEEMHQKENIMRETQYNKLKEFFLRYGTTRFPESADPLLFQWCFAQRYCTL